MAWYPVKYKPDMLEIIASSTPFDYSKLESESEIIPQYSFHGSKIEHLTSTAVLTVGDRAFEGCNGLDFINLPHCTSVGQYAFSCERAVDRTVENPYRAVDIYLNDVVTIGAYAFYNYGGCDDIAELIFPACTSVNQNAFAASSTFFLTVKSIILPSVTYVGASAFQRVVAETIQIGNSSQEYTGLRSAMSTPLANATVTNLIMYPKTPPGLSTNAGLGNGATISHIYVPDGTDPDSGKTYVQLYKDANRWSNYASIIDSISNMPT